MKLGLFSKSLGKDGSYPSLRCTYFHEKWFSGISVFENWSHCKSLLLVGECWFRLWCPWQLFEMHFSK